MERLFRHFNIQCVWNIKNIIFSKYIGWKNQKKNLPSFSSLSKLP
jgi:mevalonate pyrophosphate decarboxylase